MSQTKRIRAHRKVLLITCIVFAVYAAMLIFPIAWIFMNSFKDFLEFSDSAWSLPSVPKLENYAFIFEKFNMGEAFFNSLILCVTCPTIGTTSTACAAYALSKFEFRGRKFLFYLHLVPMLVSIGGGTSTLFLFYYKLNLYDTFLSMIISSAGGMGMNFLLVHSVFRNISKTYMEAAEIDGASDFTVFFRIMLPQAIGIIGVLWMLSFIGCWNEYASYNLFLPSHPTVSVALMTIQENVTTGQYSQHYPEFFAALMISIIPVIIIFVTFQEQIMSLSLGGGIKG